MPFLRKTMFVVFAAAYIVACPLALLYGLGYWVRPGQPKELIQTGLIYLSTAPPEATVLVGKRRYAHRTPTVIRHLPVGSYHVEVVLNGHRPWSRTIEIEAGKAVVLERILLLPATLNPSRVMAQPLEQLVPLAGSHTFFLLRGPTLRHVDLFDTRDETLRPLLDPAVPDADDRFISVIHMPDSPSCLIRALDSDGHERILRLDGAGGANRVTDVTVLFSEPPRQVQWDPRHDHLLFVLDHSRLWRLDADERAMYPAIAEQVRGFGVAGHRLYLLKDDARLIETDENGRPRRVLLDDPELGRTIFGRGSLFRIVPLSEELLVFLGEHGELLGTRLPHRFVEEGVVGLLPSGPERLLVWKRDRIGLLNFRKPAGIEGIFERPPEVQWMFTKGRHIDQVFWAYERSHVVFQDGADVWLLETETYGRPRLTHLVAVRPRTSVMYVEETGRLYYLDAQEGRLMNLEIVPRKALLLLPFPDRREERLPVTIQEP